MGAWCGKIVYMVELIRSLPNGQWFIETMEKVGEGYKKLVSNGLALLHPVSVNGKTMSDDGIPYHTTIKAFDKDKDSARNAHGIAQKLKISTPDARKVNIVPKVFKDRHGDDVHVLAMYGEDADKIIDQYSRFDGMGWPQRPEGYRPHITVDKSTYDRAVQNNAKTAADLGITFGGAELRSGLSTLFKYPHKD